MGAPRPSVRTSGHAQVSDSWALFLLFAVHNTDTAIPNMRKRYLHPAVTPIMGIRSTRVAECLQALLCDERSFVAKRPFSVGKAYGSHQESTPLTDEHAESGILEYLYRLSRGQPLMRTCRCYVLLVLRESSTAQYEVLPLLWIAYITCPEPGRKIHAELAGTPINIMHSELHSGGFGCEVPSRAPPTHLRPLQSPKIFSSCIFCLMVHT